MAATAGLFFSPQAIADENATESSKEHDRGLFMESSENRILA
jgi:hypothetical protein